MRRRTCADGSVVLNTARLVFSTAHDPARVDTALLSADVDAAHSSLGAVLLGLAAIFRQIFLRIPSLS